MADLKLPKLPDRTPVRITIALSPDLKKALDDYAALYAAAYDQQAAVTDLIPAMLAQYLMSDRGFAKARETMPGRLP